MNSQTTAKRHNERSIYEYIKNNVSIEEVAKLLNLDLTKSGQNLQGNCPTNHHSQGGKCFSINTTKKFFHCFSCGIAGDVLSLVEIVNKLGPSEAIEWIVKNFNLQGNIKGLNLHFREYTEEEKEERRQQHERDFLYEKVFEWMKELLYDGTGQKELDYLVNERKYNLETLKKTDWCYFSEADKIKEYLLNQFPDRVNSIYELPLSGFTGDKIHLALPYRNRNGLITGFMKRAPMPEGILIEKGGKEKSYRWDSTYGLNKNDLYNIDKCKAQDKLVIVEGYPDAAYLFALGMENITAVGQGQLSESHLEGLQRSGVKYVTISFDNDEVGPKNTEKAVQLILEKTNITPFVLEPSLLTPHKDPDEYVKANGIEAFKKLLSSVQSGVVWLCKLKLKNINADPITKKQILDECLKLALLCNNLLSLKEIIALTSKELKLKETDIVQMMKDLEKNDKVNRYKEIELNEHERFFPFIELGTDSLSYYDRINGVAHLGVKKEILPNILYSAGQFMPYVLPVLSAVFDVHSNERINLEKELFNFFVPSKYMLLEKDNKFIDPRKSFPHIYMLISNLLPVYKERKLFLNWLAGILQTREKQLTAWVLKGEQGAGKGLLLNKILKPLFGRNQVIQVEDQQLQNPYNPWLQNVILIAFNEVAHNNDTRNSIKSKVKAIITDSEIRINDKYIREFGITNYVNCLFFSNESVPVFIEDQDRRFNVIETGKNLNKKVEFNSDPEKFIVSLEEEVPMFAQFLMNWNYDEIKAKTVLNNKAKQKLVEIGRTKYEEFAYRLKEKDIEWLSDHFSGFGNNLETKENLKLDISKNRIKKETARNIFRIAFSVEASQVEFAKKLKLEGLTPKRIEINNRKEQYFTW